MKRLEKWLREIAEKLESEARSPPSGIIQMNSALLHHISKDIEQPFNLLLVPAHLFMSKVRDFKNLKCRNKKIFHHFNMKTKNISTFFISNTRIKNFAIPWRKLSKRLILASV